jgi:ubiquinone/menaquinone biosynthesis C-methylase UbiE
MDWRQQFAKPEGPLGWVVGHAMAIKNRERSEFVFSLLDLQPSDHVLEIGFGPGADLSRASRQAAFIAGIDHSDVIRDGRVQVQLGSVYTLPFPDASFDKIFAINAAQFWKDLPAALAEISRVLKPRGLLTLAIQPRQKGATEDHVHHAARAFAAAMQKAGFSALQTESRAMKPVSTACVTGVNFALSASLQDASLRS